MDHHWLDWVLSALAGLFMLILKRESKRHDDMETIVHEMQKNYITRTELHHMLTEMKIDRKAIHEENKDALKEIRTDVKAMSRDISDLTGSRRRLT